MNNSDYEKILSLVDDNKYNQCIAFINELLEENDQSPKLFHLLGLCQLEIAKSTENEEIYILALNSFKTAISIFPQRIRSLIMCAEISSKLGQNEDALLFYDQVLSIKPEIEFNNRYGKKDPEIILMQKLGYLDEALERINLLLSRNSSDNERIKRKMYILDKMGKTEEALLFYNQVLSINPEIEFKGWDNKDPEIDLMRKLGHLDEALERINLLLSRNCNDGARIKRKIHILDKMGKVEETIELIDQFLNASGFDKPVFRLKVRLIRKHWANQQILDFLEESIRNYPEDLILNEVKTAGSNIIRDGKVGLALNILEMVSAKGIDCSDDIAECFTQIGRYEEAIAIYQKNQRFNSAMVRNLTHCYINIENYPAALDVISNYLEKEPSNHDALSSQAFILAKMNRIDEAIGIYETISIKSRSWNVCYQLYKIYYEKKERTIANNYLQEAILLNPNRDILWYEKGMLSLDLNQLEIAEISFQRSIALNKNFIQSYIGLAKILKMTAKWDEALEKLKSAMEIAPDDSFVAQEMGYVRAKVESSEEIKELRNNYQNEIDNKIGQIHSINVQLLEEKSLSNIVKSILSDVSEKSEIIQQDFLTSYLSEEDESIKSELIDDFCYNLRNMLDDKLENRRDEVQIIELSIKQTCEFSHKLEDESLCAIATGDFLMQAYKYNLDLDFSPVVIEYCKALECELYTKLFKKIRAHLRLFSPEQLRDAIKEDEKQKKLKQVCLFFKGDKELTLGEITFILTFVNSKSESSKSILLKVMKNFIETKTQNPNLFLSKDGFISRIKTIVEYYRNPAAHVKILNSDDARLCRAEVFGCLNDFAKSF